MCLSFTLLRITISDPKFETEFATDDLLLTEVDEVRIDSELSSDMFLPIEMKAWSKRIHKKMRKIPPT